MAEAFLYKASLPYPPLAVSKPDPAKVRILLELYSGPKSKTTAILQYNYQSAIAEPFCDSIKSVLEHISYVETSHLTILARMIYLCGGTPRYIMPSKQQYWTAQAVNYTNDVCKMLLCDLEDEVAAIDAYLNAAKRINDTKAAAVLQRIAQDELCHVEIIKKLLADCRHK
ncbi:MAG: ferritin-like domain-containing protein [Angelakisella sp.]|nr:ferritin-like domain-containing protein [Angelakisella sp.]